MIDAYQHVFGRLFRDLSIELGGEAVAIKVNGDTGMFVGSVVGFERMARELETFAEDDELDEPGSHAHFDPGDDVLAPDSCALIVAGPTPDEAAPEIER